MTFTSAFRAVVNFKNGFQNKDPSELELNEQ